TRPGRGATDDHGRAASRFAARPSGRGGRPADDARQWHPDLPADRFRSLWSDLWPVGDLLGHGGVDCRWRRARRVRAARGGPQEGGQVTREADAQGALAPRPASLVELFLVFSKLALHGFGGVLPW